MITADPGAMTEAERLDELAALLARGVQRRLAAERKVLLGAGAVRRAEIQQNRLDVVAAAEAPCGSQVQSPKSRKSTA